MPCIALLEALHDAQCMEVVIETQTMPSQTIVQRALAGMSEGWMADVMDQGQRLS